jgi:hypothetical protein
VVDRDRARTGAGPPLRARTCEPSITARDMSSWSAARTLPSSTSCSRCTRRRRSSPAGVSRSSLTRTPTLEVGTPRDPGVEHEQDPAQHQAIARQLTTTGLPVPTWPTGSNGSISAHRSSETIHGGCSPPHIQTERSPPPRDTRQQFVTSSKLPAAPVTVPKKTHGAEKESPYTLRALHCRLYSGPTIGQADANRVRGIDHRRVDA